MRYTIEAKYYDGQSSASHQIRLMYDGSMEELRLHTADDSEIVWFQQDLEFERYPQSLDIRNKKHSGAILKVSDPEFIQRFYERLKQNGRVDIHTRLMGLGFSKIVAIAISMLALVILAYFFVLPPVAEKAATLLPESFDNEIGDAFMSAFLDENDIDSFKTRQLELFVAELKLNNSKPLQFAVVESDVVNAFALPNGQIVIYTAIIDNMESPDELVALIGHEASHVNERHSIKMLCRNLAGYFIVSLLLSDVNGIMAVLADNAQQLHSLSFSRKFEQEADEQGLKIMMNNHVNPNGMARLFEQLEEENDLEIPEILSTHPVTDERKKHIEKIISKSTYEIQANEKLSMLFEKLKR